MKSNIRVSISSCTTPPEAELALQVTITNWGEGTGIRPEKKKKRKKEEKKKEKKKKESVFTVKSFF